MAINELDLRLKLLAGIPWVVDGVGKIYPPTLREIVDVGYTTYLNYVNLMTLDPKVLIPDEPIVDQIIGFDFFCAKESETELIDEYLKALKFFFREEEACFISHHMSVYFGDLNVAFRVINRVNYNQIKDIINLITCSKGVQETSFNPAGEKAREIVEKFNERKKKLKMLKARDNEDDEVPKMDLYDLISAVSSKSNTVGKTNVWDLNFYQLMDEYKRLERINQYEVNTMAMIQVGGDKIELKHWSSKIVDED